MKYDVFVIIADEVSKYEQDPMSFRSTFLEYINKDTTVVVISACSSIQRIFAGGNVASLIDFPPLVKGNQSTNSSQEIMSWIYEVQYTREADGKTSESIGVYADFDSSKHRSVLSKLKKIKEITLINVRDVSKEKNHKSSNNDSQNFSAQLQINTSPTVKSNIQTSNGGMQTYKKLSHKLINRKVWQEKVIYLFIVFFASLTLYAMCYVPNFFPHTINQIFNLVGKSSVLNEVIINNNGFLGTNNGTGTGRGIYTDGKLYFGDFVDGNRNGKGVLIDVNNRITYEGDFSDNHFSGYGKKTLANGDIYEGDFFDGVIIGKGKLTFVDGRTYEGGVTNDLLNGHGKMTWPSGDLYEGEFANGLFNGAGKYSFSNGDVFEGNFVDGKISNGAGKYSWSNGDVFEGNFVDGKLVME